MPSEADGLGGHTALHSGPQPGVKGARLGAPDQSAASMEADGRHWEDSVRWRVGKNPAGVGCLVSPKTEVQVLTPGPCECDFVWK